MTVLTQKALLLCLGKCKHLNQFKEIHAYLLKFPFFAQNPLSIDRLLSAAALSPEPLLFSYGCSIFRHLLHRSTFMYNTMIRGYVQNHAPGLAILCYLDVLKNGFDVNNYTFTPLIKGCSLLLPLPTGRLVHGHIVKFGFSNDVFIRSALVEFYSLVPDLETARGIFDRSLRKDVVLWTAMVNCYAKAGDMVAARDLFETMPERNVVSWSALIAGYSQTSDYKEVLFLFHQMQELGREPNESLLVSVLTACANLGALAQGMWIHSYVKRCGLNSNLILATALVDMYAKCGSMDFALSVFYDASPKDLALWNALLSGFAMNSDSAILVELFPAMCKAGVQPNGVTFIALLSACTHSGLVNEGLKLYEEMSSVYGVKPQPEHKACMVDLLSRAGLLEEAEKFIEEKMGNVDERDFNVWGALLSACKIHRNVEVANRVWGKLSKTGFADSGICVLLHNIFAQAGWETQAHAIRRLITEKNLKKKPGCSLIEVDGMVEEFRAGKSSQPQGKDVSEALDSLMSIARLEALV